MSWVRSGLAVSVGLVWAATAFADLRSLPFEARLQAEARVQEVYDRRRSQATRRGPRKPADLTASVETTLRKCAALASVWQEPIDAAALQAEVERIARDTRDPTLLRELFAVLDHDPVLIAECLARPCLASRLFSKRFARDRAVHAEVRERARQCRALLTSDTFEAAGAQRLETEDLVPDAEAPRNPPARALDPPAWRDALARVDAIGPVEEIDDAFVISRLQRRSDSALQRQSIVFAKVSPEEWLEDVPLPVDWREPAVDTGRLRRVLISGNGTSDFHGEAPDGRDAHTAVWTGSEMIVWGGGHFSQGGRYDPATDTWRPTSTGAGCPEGRSYHTAVWTGTEMIVWGTKWGGPQGARYDPTTDIWTAVSSGPNAPRNQSGHCAVWTGSEMIVWGGRNSATATNTGGRYDPATDTWSPTSAWGSVPSPREEFSAVWTGSEMIVWGGSDPNGELATGGRYDPLADSWTGTAIDTAVAPWRKRHTAVWTGQEMIVWGGWGYLVNNSGGRYDPATDTWTPAAERGAAPRGRSRHSAVWTGAEMIVWGGEGLVIYLRSGGRYYPVTDSWLETTLTMAPQQRASHGAVWTGSEMIVWGGDPYTSTGGLYDPASDRWTTVSGAGAPSPRGFHACVWTGTEMIVWGGYDGAYGLSDGFLYDPILDSWRPMSPTNAPAYRFLPACVWTGTEMIVWSGLTPYGVLDDGARYDPQQDLWTPMTKTGAPVPRYLAATVWTGDRMVVWGGKPGGYCCGQDGGRYDPVLDVWQSTSEGDGVPARRVYHTAVWDGASMLVWGGTSRYQVFMSTGGAYDPVADVWANTWNAPLGEDVVAGKPAGGASAYTCALKALRVDGGFGPFALDPFPAFSGFGVHGAAGDVEIGGTDEVLATPGPGPASPPEVRAFHADGTPVAGCDFLTYGTTGFGARIGAGAIDGSVEILTGPGPSGTYGPHVRAFRYAAGAVQALAKVSFFAYGTLRYGVAVAAGELDGDGFDEVLTGAGPGAVFGPHVRGFDYDATAVAPIAKVSFFAYGTLRYGVEEGAADVGGDGYEEILTGPGPSFQFASQLRGFNVDGGTATAMGRINAVVFAGAHYGLHVAGGDLETDGFDEIVVGPGPDPLQGTTTRGFDYDGASLAAIPALDRDVFGLGYGLDVSTAGLGF